MVKTTKTKTYNTETATVVKKVAYGTFGDPTGYEMTMQSFFVYNRYSL